MEVNLSVRVNEKDLSLMGLACTLSCAHTTCISTPRAEGGIGPSRPELIAAPGGGGTLVYVTIMGNERPHISGMIISQPCVYRKKRKKKKKVKKKEKRSGMRKTQDTDHFVSRYDWQ